MSRELLLVPTPPMDFRACSSAARAIRCIFNTHVWRYAMVPQGRDFCAFSPSHVTYSGFSMLDVHRGMELVGHLELLCKTQVDHYYFVLDLFDSRSVHGCLLRRLRI